MQESDFIQVNGLILNRMNIASIKRLTSLETSFAAKPVVSVSFTGGDSVQLDGEEAQAVWDFFNFRSVVLVKFQEQP